MEKISIDVGYDAKYVSAAVFDIVGGMSRDIARDADGQIAATVRVYDNESRFAVGVQRLGEDSTRLTVSITEPACVLSADGQRRAVRFLTDSIQQLLENVFYSSNKPNLMKRGI